VFDCLRACNVVSSCTTTPILLLQASAWLSPVGPWPVMVLMSVNEQKSPVSKDILPRDYRSEPNYFHFDRMNVVAGFALEKVGF
jgi:hypothetical protein